MSGAAALGDLVRAFARLHPQEGPAQRIAALLGYELPAAAPSPAAPGSGPAPRLEQVPSTFPARGTSTPGATPSAGAPRRPVQDSHPRSLPWRRYLQPVGRAQIDRRGAGTSLPAEGGGFVAQRPPEPLLPAATTAALVQAAVATDTWDEDVDVELVVAALARRRRVESLPRRPRRTLVRGVQLLTDVAPAMAPYLADADLVAAAVEAVVGRPHVQRLHFQGTPLDGAGAGPAWTWSTYTAPPPGTPVLALTELGLARVPGRLVSELQQSWLDLRELLARRDSPLIVFTPFPLERWPGRLARELDLVHWDRSCSVSTIQRARGRRSFSSKPPW